MLCSLCTYSIVQCLMEIVVGHNDLDSAKIITCKKNKNKNRKWYTFSIIDILT